MAQRRIYRARFSLCFVSICLNLFKTNFLGGNKRVNREEESKFRAGIHNIILRIVFLVVVVTVGNIDRNDMVFEQFYLSSVYSFKIRFVSFNVKKDDGPVSAEIYLSSFVIRISISSLFCLKKNCILPLCLVTKRMKTSVE